MVPNAKRRTAKRQAIALRQLSALFAALLPAALLVSVLKAAAPAQTVADLFLPDVQAELRSTSSGMTTMGQEGLGATTIDVLNLGTAQGEVQLRLVPKSGVEPARLLAALAGGQSMRFDLADHASVTGGFYSGEIKSDQPLAASARVEWSSGAAAAYEAAPAATEFLLPLVARAVYSHTTILYAQNADGGPAVNAITMQILDRSDGGMLNETTCTAEVGETCTWDTAHAAMTFGPEVLGVNAPTGGWLGHLWFRAARPIAVSAYGDEMAAQGSSAYLGRPVAAAATQQWLPFVRRSASGGSLIAIANAGRQAARVTISYRGASWSPVGAGETYRQDFTIAVRGAVYLDLAERGRGSIAASQPPGGDAPDAGFVGSALIEASQPVLAVVQDEQLLAGKVDAIAAYNAFGPEDLGGAWRVPTVLKMVGYRSTVLLVQNPTDDSLAVTVDVADERGAPADQLTAVVPSGEVVRLPLAEVESLPVGIGSATVRTSAPSAVLVLEERDPRGKPQVVSTVAYIRAIGEGHVSGIARFVEKGPDVQVNLQISGTWPGARYSASIVRGACGGKQETAYSLTEPADNKSTTLLRNLSIKTLTEKPHAVVIQSAGWPGRPARDVACGDILTPPGAEIIDSTLSWALRLSRVPALPTPTPLPATATWTPVATEPWPTATASPTSLAIWHRIYLPRADR